MPTVITTSTSGIATGFCTQRKVDRCQNGVLWTFFNSETNIQPAYSSDNGQTWTTTSPIAITASRVNSGWSVFIDLDDYCHLVYKDTDGFTTSYVRYRRGTPNAGRTSWTWSSPVDLGSSGVNADYYEHPDVIAHREGTGWHAHAVWSYATAANGNSGVVYRRVDITSGGTITAAGTTTTIGLGLASDNSMYPSIDFHHTGDGKTVAGSAPHLFVAWSMQGTGAGNGIRYKKAAYSGGAWTWGTEREVDSARYVSNDTQSIQTMFDGTRVIIVGFVEGGGDDLMLYERDVSDTTTTTYTLLDSPATSLRLVYGSSSYDSAGNVYVVGRNIDETAGTHDLVYRKWTRAGGSLGSEVVVDSGVGNPYVSAKRGYSSTRIEFVYTDGTASPFNVTYDAIVLNVAPNTPTNLAPSGGVTIDRAVTNRFSWTFSDPDPGDTQSKFDLRYRLVGAGTWTDILNQQTVNAFYDFSGGTFAAGDYEWQVRTYDSQGAVSAYTASAFYTAANAPSGPTITNPINNQVLTGQSYTVVWSVTNQDAFQVRTVADNAGAPDTATVYTDTGEIASTTDRSRSVAFLTNNRFEHVQVRVKYTGLWSAWASVRVQVSYTVPPTPTFVLTANNSAGTLSVAITNPAPTGGQPALSHNDVYVNDGAGEQRKATGVAANGTFVYRTPVSGRNYASYVRVVAHGVNGTTASS
jgi:hypothetical protein